jgi:hypothetical protein
VLPGPEWEGWKPDVSLQKIKLRFVNQAGMDVSEFGFFPDDVRETHGVPNVAATRRTIPQMFSMGNLNAALKGTGLRDIEIKGSPAAIANQDTVVDVQFDVKYDRKQDITQVLNDNINIFR